MQNLSEASNFREVKRVAVSKDLCDELGHMNIQYYYATLSDGMFRVMEIMGISKCDILERRLSFVLYKEEAEFINEICEGDEFYMATALEHIGTKSIIFEHRFFNVKEDFLLFRSRFVSVLMDLKLRSGIPITPAIRQSALQEFPSYNEI